MLHIKVSTIITYRHKVSQRKLLHFYKRMSTVQTVEIDLSESQADGVFYPW